MPSISVGDKFLVSLRGQMCNSQIISTFWFQCSTLGTNVDYAANMNALWTALNGASGLKAKFLACCPPEYVLLEAWLQKVDPTRLVSVKVSVVADGTYGEHATTANLAAVITRRGDGAQRKDLSSLHLPYANEDPGITNGTVAANMLTAMDTLATQMVFSVTATPGSTFNPVIRNGPLSTDVTLITQAFSQDTVRVMRRRTLRIGK